MLPRLHCSFISVITADDDTYPGVVFDWTPSGGIAARGEQGQGGGEEGPPELLLHPSRLLWLWV